MLLCYKSAVLFPGTEATSSSFRLTSAAMLAFSNLPLLALVALASVPVSARRFRLNFVRFADDNCHDAQAIDQTHVQIDTKEKCHSWPDGIPFKSASIGWAFHNRPWDQAKDYGKGIRMGVYLAGSSNCLLRSMQDVVLRGRTLQGPTDRRGAGCEVPCSVHTVYAKTDEYTGPQKEDMAQMYEQVPGRRLCPW